MEFTQIDHEKWFKFILMSQFILITVCDVLLFVWTHIVEPGALFGRLYFLTEDFLVDLEVGKAYLVFLAFGNVVTALAMVTDEICSWVMRPASTITHPVCSVGFIANHIPFFSLNLPIVMMLVVQAVTMGFFEFIAPFWLNASALITIILVKNKGARAHVATRLRQQIESFTIGGNNTVHLVVPIALVPLRSLTESASTLPTSTRVTTCPEESRV